eukprot:TRINITY_DN594_c0_g1_i1.p1 TRINITY_DN594_c0_g1~~TRINITY_DN594_c0_g1_i1.p1  ORF type:complete len:252 (+),score=57.41 TRINITY_DN594_c0_g1_i1:281-1036(+)
MQNYYTHETTPQLTMLTTADYNLLAAYERSMQNALANSDTQTQISASTATYAQPIPDDSLVVVPPISPDGQLRCYLVPMPSVSDPSFSMMTPSYSSMSNMSAASIQSFHSLQSFQSFQSFQSSNSHQTLHTSQSLPLPPATRTPVVSAIQKSIHKPFAAARAMASTPVTGTRDRPVHSAASASARKKKAINPYIAFSMHMRKQRLQVDPFIGNRALILEIGQMWANMAASERLKYADLAKELNESLERESN